MARFLVIDNDGPHVTLLAVSGGRGAKIEQVRTWTLDSTPSLATADAVGRSLRDRLDEWRIASAPLIVGVGRDRVVFKEIKHPAVPAHEEPAVVRFQALKELTEAVDEVVIDYQPRPGTGSERRALVVSTKKEVLRLAQQLAQAAGLKLHAVVPRPFAYAAAARAASAPPEPDTAYAVLAIGTTTGEFVVAKGEEILFARPVGGPALVNDTALLGEVRRNLAVHTGQHPSMPVRAIYIAEGGGLKGFTERIKTTLAVPVIALDPLAGTGVISEGMPGQVAAAVGLGRLAFAGPLPINFVHPREPKPVADPHRRPLLIGAGIAASLLLAVALIAWLQLSAQDKVIAGLRADLDGTTTDLATIEPKARKGDEVHKWLDSEIVWLDELYDLAAMFPDVARLRLTQFTADPIPLPPNPKPNARLYVARVSIEGLATNEPKPLTTFMHELAKDYKAENKNTKPLSFGADRRSFRYQFSTRYELEKRSADQYTRQFTATVPGRRSRGGGGNPQAGDLINLFLGGGAP